MQRGDRARPSRGWISFVGKFNAFKAQPEEKPNAFHEALVNQRLGRPLRPLNREISGVSTRARNHIDNKSDLCDFSHLISRNF
jgi:hypothetical protein